MDDIHIATITRLIQHVIYYYIAFHSKCNSTKNLHPGTYCMFLVAN